MGTICIMSLRLAGNYGPYCWYRYTGLCGIPDITEYYSSMYWHKQRWWILCSLLLVWAVLNTFALEVIAFIDIISIWWQVVGGTVIVILLPLVALTTQPASYVFTHFETTPDSTGISSKAYAVILSVLVSQYSLYRYDAAAHLTEETRGADKNGQIAILTSIGVDGLRYQLINVLMFN